MYLLNNIIFKIISTLVIFLISIIYPTSSKTNDGSFELSMDCTDKNKILKSYIKKETKICFIENNNKEVCNTFSSNDSSLFQYVIEYDNTIEIIDFSNLNVSVSSQNNFSKLKCKNFKKNSKVVNNNSYKITENYESNKNLNLKELEGTEKNRDFTIDSIINFEKKFYNSLSSRNFSYFPEDFLEIKKLRNEISSNLQQRNVKKTSTKIKSLFNKLITLEKKIDNQYLNSLSNAKSNYQNLAYYKAKENINLALQLKPQSSEALKLESLINKLPKKLKILENLKISRKENNKLKELFFLKELDSIENSKTIKNQILGLENELKLNNFEDLMSQSENFLKEKNIKQAELNFNKAKQIFPSRQEIKIFQKKIENLKKANLKNQLLLDFKKHSKNDKWELALDSLKRIEKIDQNDAYVSQKINMTQDILILEKNFKNYLKNSHRLINEKFENKVLNDLKKSRQYLSMSKNLANNYQKIQKLVKESTKKVAIKIISDNETEIEIRGVGKVGKIDEKILQLLPGKYYIIGKKQGFKNIFYDLDLTNRDIDNNMIELSIICSEFI